MPKGVIDVHGKEVNVREDTYRAYRGVKWAIVTIIVFAAIVGVMFLAGFFATVSKGGPTSPAQTERPGQPQ